MKFSTPLGFITYRQVLEKDRTEYTNNETFWQSKIWIQIDCIRVHEKFKKHGKTLLNEFITSKKRNIVLNAVLSITISHSNLYNSGTSNKGSNK